MVMFSRYCLITAVSIATALAQRGPQGAAFEGQPALTLSNDKLQMTITLQGSAIASLILTDDTEKISPFGILCGWHENWDTNRISMARWAISCA